MKELSTEQKVKAYDEALSVARKTHQTQPMYRDWLEKMFPELAESEDERIRKALIDYFRWNPNGQLLNEFTNREVFAWLKKQDEKSYARYKIGDTIYYNSFGRLVSFTITNIVEDGTDNPMYEDKDGNSVFQNDIVEPKSAEQNIDNRKLFDIVIEELSKYSRNEVYKAPWALDSTGVQYPLYFAELGAKWQKEQKPAEWSEEDEEISSAIVKRLEGSCALSVDLQSAICWVENVKDRVQSQWKPSEEQIKAIRIARSFVISDNPILSELLVELEEQLKKLREE